MRFSEPRTGVFLVTHLNSLHWLQLTGLSDRGEVVCSPSMATLIRGVLGEQFPVRALTPGEYTEDLDVTLIPTPHAPRGSALFYFHDAAAVFAPPVQALPDVPFPVRHIFVDRRQARLFPAPEWVSERDGHVQRLLRTPRPLVAPVYAGWFLQHIDRKLRSSHDGWHGFRLAADMPAVLQRVWRQLHPELCGTDPRARPIHHTRPGQQEAWSLEMQVPDTVIDRYWAGWADGRQLQAALVKFQQQHPGCVVWYW